MHISHVKYDTFWTNVSDCTWQIAGFKFTWRTTCRKSGSVHIKVEIRVCVCVWGDTLTYLLCLLAPQIMEGKRGHNATIKGMWLGLGLGFSELASYESQPNAFKLLLFFFFNDPHKIQKKKRILPIGKFSLLICWTENVHKIWSWSMQRCLRNMP